MELSYAIALISNASESDRRLGLVADVALGAQTKDDQESELKNEAFTESVGLKVDDMVLVTHKAALPTTFKWPPLTSRHFRRCQI